jgi:hypothetical protein
LLHDASSQRLRRILRALGGIIRAVWPLDVIGSTIACERRPAAQ